MKTKAINKQTLIKISSVVLALVIWQIVAMSINSSMLLASPIEVISRFATIWKQDNFFVSIANSFLRIFGGFLIAFVVGTVIGVLAGRFRAVESFMWPYVITIKTVPVASFIVLFLLWMDFTRLTILISFLIAFPVIYTNVRQGYQSTDRKLKEVAAVYKVTAGKQLRYIYIPSIKPFLLSATSLAIGMAWKAGVAAEIIGLIDNSIGDQIYSAKVYFQNADLLCWTLILIIVSIICEKLFNLALKGIFRGIERNA